MWLVLRGFRQHDDDMTGARVYSVSSNDIVIATLHRSALFCFVSLADFQQLGKGREMRRRIIA